MIKYKNRGFIMSDLHFLAEWDKLLAKIAEVMNTSVEAIQVNAGEYLILFARYQLISDITRCLFAGVFIGVVATTVIWLLNMDEDSAANPKKYTKVFIITTAIISSVFFGVELLKYLVSPEIYGIKELLRLIK